MSLDTPSLAQMRALLGGALDGDPDGDPISQALADVAQRARLPRGGGLFGGDYARFMANRGSGQPPIDAAAAPSYGDPSVQLTPSPQAFGPQASGITSDVPTMDPADNFRVAGPAIGPQFGLRPSQVGSAKEAEMRGTWAAGDLVRDAIQPLISGFSRTWDDLRGPQPEQVRSSNPVANWAEAHVGHGGYGRWFSTAPDARGLHDDVLATIGWRGVGDPKCNQFVWDALSNAGVPPGRIDGGRIPLAKDWGDPKSKIPGYSPVNGPLQPGDVVSNGDHVGIYAPLPNGHPGTISAASPFHNGGALGGVAHNDWGFRGDEGKITAWRPVPRDAR
jgi:hypothetical protein